MAAVMTGADQASWWCEACELAAVPRLAAEAAHLARVHDLLRHGGVRTAELVEAVAR